MSYSAPSQEERQRYRATLLTMLRDAVKVELSTIPLYLYSIYSIKKDSETSSDKKGGTQARAKISVVVHQEMLHLALAGNLLRSIGESGPHLYSVAFLPTYGGADDVILKTQIPLRLERCEKSNLECFLKIEAPYQAPPKLSAEEERANIARPRPGVHAPMAALDEYNSIGEFYTKLEEMIINCKDYIDFDHKGLQFSATEFFADKMTQVVDQKSAHDALKIIIDQGEGSVGVEDAHYQMFLQLYLNRTEWECWQVPDSPKTRMYEAVPFLHELARASDAAYCYLLVTIQKTWQVSDLVLRRGLIANIHSIMVNVMTPIAEFMVEQSFGSGEGKAAPAFQFYQTTAGEQQNRVDEAARELHAAIKSHLESAISATQDDSKKKALKVIKFAAERISWVV